MDELEKWLGELSEPVPLEASDSTDKRSSLARLLVNSGSFRGSLVEALLGLRIGLIDSAHEIVQTGNSAIEKYIHGVVHRLEGDYWNSKYWFRQVGDRELLNRIGQIISDILTAPERDFAKEQGLLTPGNGWHPAKMVDAQERLCADKNANRDYLRQVGHAEWQALWTISQ